MNWKLLVIGLVAGLVNGLLGVGGGTILVPALTLWHKVDDHEAHGSTLATILPTAMVSSLIYARGGYLNWPLAGKVALGGAIGSLIGSRWLESMPSATLRRVFSALMIILGLQMFWRR